jgi:S-adenosylmethionine:tRNA ribosyltransferase-isomerase
MMNPADISILDYNYTLPEDRIALHPLEQRDSSKLLICKDRQITETVFSAIDQWLPADSLLVINNTRVINARLRFQKSTGARIEIFCLEPFGPIREYASVMSNTARSVWKCLVGGAAKWKEGCLGKNIIVDGKEVILSATMLEKIPEAYIIELSWTPADYSFAAIIEAAGDIPLPPYIKRETDQEDRGRYQTVFAKEEGSVAAPTAGLHFTKDLFNKLLEKNIQQAQLTLHVGAGTFKPVKAASMKDHEMHAEYIEVNIQTIAKLKENAGKIIAVGTTSCRTLESLYWLGVKASLYPAEKKLQITQWDVYQPPLLHTQLTVIESLNALTDWLIRNELQQVSTQTQLMIAPGYRFRMVNLLITNFHQPQSTLLLLVAAAIGEDWKIMYDYALENKFRFLSYGDANLIWVNSPGTTP